MFSYLYTKKLIKNGGKLFNLWCWLAQQRWYHIILIPMHIVKGYYYKYSIKQIYYFCKGNIFNKIYKEQYKPKEIETISECLDRVELLLEQMNEEAEKLK